MYLEIKSFILKVEHKICLVKQIVSYNSYRYEKFVSFSNFSDENNSISIPNRKIHVPKISPLPLRIDPKRISIVVTLLLVVNWS